MSDETKSTKPLEVSYTPPLPELITKPPATKEQEVAALPPQEPMMSAAFYQNQQEFFFRQVVRFKEMFEDSTLAKYIVMAGISGVIIAVIELVRAFVQAVYYIRHF